ncbi:MAG: ABC transporter ATP-binding protein, partial [Cyanobacteria bacterium J083]
MAKVVIENLYKSFPRRSSLSGLNSVKQAEQSGSGSNYLSILRSINFTVADGEFIVLVGPSGCGKSTLLRIIAGLETLTAGNVIIGNRLVNNLPPKARDIAMVFQNYALYPHLNVYDNIAFGLRRTQAEIKSLWQDRLLTSLTRPFPHRLQYLSPSEKKVAHRVQEVAELLQIDLLLQRLPKELSGGQKQRVALGRAIARNPQVFLMDEPLSNLDAKLRTETRSQIVKLQRQLGITTIYVTHDQTEAMTMGNRIAVMNKGQIQQIASPLEIYRQPANRFVAQFIGSPPMNFLKVRYEKGKVIHPEFTFSLSTSWQEVLLPYERQEILLGIRPEHLTLADSLPQNIPGVIDLVEALGNDTYITFHLPSNPAIQLQARIKPDYVI